MSEETQEAAVVLKGPLPDLQRAAEMLERHGIASAIVSPDADCSSCSPVMWLAVAPHNVSACLDVFRNDWRSGLDPEQLEAANAADAITIDPDAAEQTCPACLTRFATGPTECPECGLCIG